MNPTIEESTVADTTLSNLAQHQRIEAIKEAKALSRGKSAVEIVQLAEYILNGTIPAEAPLFREPADAGLIRLVEGAAE